MEILRKILCSSAFLGSIDLITRSNLMFRNDQSWMKNLIIFSILNTIDLRLADILNIPRHYILLLNLTTVVVKYLSMISENKHNGKMISNMISTRQFINHLMKDHELNVNCSECNVKIEGVPPYIPIGFDLKYDILCCKCIEKYIETNKHCILTIGSKKQN